MASAKVFEKLAAPLAILLGATVVTACGASWTPYPSTSAPATAVAATSVGVPTVAVLDWYGQVLADACRRLQDGATDVEMPAGATSPLNAGPPHPEDEPARPAIDAVPIPAGATLIDERTTSSLDEPDAHGIQRTYCVGASTSSDEIERLLAWAHHHTELTGAGGVAVQVLAEYLNPKSRELYVQATLAP